MNTKGGYRQLDIDWLSVFGDLEEIILNKLWKSKENTGIIQAELEGILRFSPKNKLNNHEAIMATFQQWKWPIIYIIRNFSTDENDLSSI